MIKTLGERDSAQLSVNFAEAARRLGFKSSKTISRMEKQGLIQSVLLSGTKMIPVSELVRVTTPKPEKVRRGGAPKKSTYSVDDDVARLAEMIRQRRRR